MKQPLPTPPGTVIRHQPAISGLFIGSPSIAILGDGTYVASHDFFGPGSREHERGGTLIHRSTDRGRTWQQSAAIEGAFWSGLFVHDGALYLMGLTCHHGLLVIRRSEDGGRSWTSPVDERSGLLTPEGQYHTAPMPVIIHSGRIWRAIEDAGSGTTWGQRYNPMLVSAPIGADLLDRANWTFSTMAVQSPEWLEGAFGGWLEGNAVTLDDGRMADLLRVHHPRGEKAALAILDPDGRTLTFHPEHDMIELPGAATKFAVRKDPESGAWWTLANAVPPRHAEDKDHHTQIRNTLALLRSTDLRHWEMRYIPLYHPDSARHGFQYVDWLIEGRDLVFVCRTAWEDASGGARNEHDANYLTFHRIRDFRDCELMDSPANPFQPESDISPAPAPAPHLATQAA